jgi:hypothetical protein
MKLPMKLPVNQSATASTTRRIVALVPSIALVTLFLLAPPVLAENPAAEGFDAAGSDAKAIAIADQVMAAMGGRAPWDQTRYLSWNFFGLRTHVWDRWSGDHRFMQGNRLVLMNIGSKQGRAWTDGEELAGEDLAKALDDTYKAWINDSYWLLMPYKLKDSGVTLTYKEEGALADGRPADVLQLTFKGVGVTPQNKYDVYVSQDKHLVEQWSYYPTADLSEPQFTTPWAKWTQHGKVLLSGDRGQRQLTNIKVFDQLPGTVFADPAPVDLDVLPVAD